MKSTVSSCLHFVEYAGKSARFLPEERSGQVWTQNRPQVHEIMILIEEQKHACLECIRGHRSSSCRHYGRPLLQVRTKGRPNTSTAEQKNHRIAVFAEEILPDIREADIKSKGCSNKSNPVIILKASAKHIIDFTSGEIIHPVGGVDCKLPKVSGPYISENSFINSGTCETGGIVKPKKGCNCCPNRASKADKSKIVNSYLKRQRDLQPKLQFINCSDEVSKGADQKAASGSCCSSGRAPALKHEVEVSDEGNRTQLFDVLKVPSCTVPGSCCCGDDCGCSGCMVHGNLELGLPKNDATNVNNEYIDYINLLILKDSPSMLFDNAESSNAQLRVLSGSHESIKGEDKAGGSSPGSIHKSSTSSSSDCVCLPGACDCTNCETHGIIDGLHLDDIFAAAFENGSSEGRVQIQN